MMDWEDRFWPKVDVRGPDECWEWQAHKDTDGYGRFSVDGRVQLAHRLAWELKHGEVPDRQCICHACDNPACVNPLHLFLGTQADNLHDMAEKGRSTKGTDNPQSKLSENDVREIRRLYATAKFLQKQLSKQFGVSRSAIGQIVRRVSWVHVE